MRLPRWLSATSIFLSERTGGRKGYSFCARFYAGHLDRDPWCKLFVKITDRIFWFDPQHCRKSWLLRNS